MEPIQEPIQEPMNENPKPSSSSKAIPKKYLLIAAAVAAVVIIAALIVILIPKGHTHIEGDEVMENVVAATCDAGGSYDKVVYCKECDEELSRTRVEENALGHNFAHTVVAPTCVVPGYTLHACTNSGCTEQYTDTQVAATGHTWTGGNSCAEALTCEKCDAKQPATNHTYVEKETIAAGCATEAKIVYECSACGDRYEEIAGGALGHDISGAKPVDVQLNGCAYVQRYTCARCGEDVDGDVIERHSLTASITIAPTCMADGVKTVTCANGCGYSKTEIVERNSTGHVWVQGAVLESKRTDSCSVCQATKTVTVYTGNNTGSTSADSFKDTEIELNDTNISMDQGVVDAMGGKDVILSADKLEGDDRLDLGLDSEKLAQVGNSPIYNFTISAGDQTISEFGENNYVTITLPYALTEGEDVDNIAIWFIADNGELESIPAIYNNGYVTFKTNHFSYYTVTKLTPAQRCELYGHSNTERVVEGTCTAEGYTLHVCVRCHKTEKTDVVVADGHDFEAKTQNATCLENGKIVYTCSDCGYSYENKIFAKGHSWEIVSSEDATCTAPGSKTYSCPDCHESYTETIPQKTHELTETIVPVDCASDGYTLHKCANCDYSYKDNVIAAIGHKFTAQFTWNEDNSAAVVSLSCANNAQHNTELAATVTVKTIDATCSGGKVHEYTATIEYDGKTYTDMRSVTEGNASHNFDSAWKSNDTSHWHECSCGAKDALADHDFGEGVITREPTCVAAGIKTYTCVCGKTRNESVAATGKHNYQNGKCADCGAVGSACDHTQLHREYIDMMDYGFCGGTINYFTCDCGEVCIFDMDNSELECNADSYDQVEEETDNGQYVKANLHCSDCGMYAKVEGRLTKNGCHSKIVYVYAFFEADKVTPIAKPFTIEEEEYDHNAVRETVSAGCGGTIDIEKCRDCKEIIGIYDVNVNCAGAPEYDMDIDFGSGEAQKFTYDFSCSACGLYLDMDISLTYQGCTAIMSADVDWKQGNQVVWDYSMTEKEVDHDYEKVSCKLVNGSGSSCLDGVTTVARCTKCGDTVHYTGKHHADVEYNVSIDLSQYSSCIKKVSVDQCTVCGGFTYVHDFNYDCEPAGEPTPEQVFDENGNVVGQKLSFTCADCGLSYKQKMLDYNDGCTEIEYEEVRVYSGNTCIFWYYNEDKWTEHDYEYEFTMLGKTCDDGVKVHRVCKACGYTSDYNNKGHENEYLEIQLSDYGLCGGSISISKCRACGTISTRNVNDYHCSWNHRGEENGYIVSYCNRCGVEKRAKSVSSEKDAECCLTSTDIYEYYKNSVLVYSCMSVSEYVEHDYESTYELVGKSCEDGVTVHRVCKDCHRAYTDTYNHHVTDRKNYYELGKLGACHGSVGLYSCPCGQETWVSTDFCADEWTENSYRDTNGVSHTVSVRTCRNCGLRYQDDYYFELDVANCRRVYHHSISVSIGSVAVCSFDYIDFEQYHDYKTTATLLGGAGSSCNDGVKIERTCKTCGHNYTNEIDWHESFEINRIDLSKFGAVCGGYFVERACACGQEHYLEVTHDSFCEFDTVWKECWAEEAVLGWNGNEYFDYAFYDYVCAVTDPACGFTIRYGSYYVVEGCRAVQYSVYRFGYDAATNTYKYEYRYKTGNEKPYHVYVESEISGNEDGLRFEGVQSTCSSCGAYSVSKDYYNADGNLVKHVLEYSDKTAKDTYSYRLQVSEYTVLENMESFCTREYGETRYADGTKETYERKYAHYNNRGYGTYVYYEQRDGRWEKVVSTYDFSSSCKVNVVSTDSYGRHDEYTDTAHAMSWYYIQEPTCTRDGIEGSQCQVCGYVAESYSVSPTEHNWDYLNYKNVYVCVRCGLENANGANGDLVLEDLSDEKNYIVGYWSSNNVDFTYYVEIIVNGEPIILENVKIREDAKLRTIEIGRSTVIRAAAKLGYAEGTYLVRLSCVPYGADGSHDYAITFEDNNAQTYNIGKGEFVDLSLGEGIWDVYAFSGKDSCAEVLDAYGNYIGYDDDSGAGNNFFVRVEVPAGETYTVRVRWLSESDSGEIDVIVERSAQ